MSQDLEDLISVVDGRASLLHEIRNTDSELRVYIASEIESLLTNPDFVTAVPGFLPSDPASQRRVPALLDKLRKLAALKE